MVGSDIRPALLKDQMNTTEGHVSTNTTMDAIMDLSQISSVSLTVGIINLILGLPTNCYALWVIANRAEGTMASEVFTLNMVISQILTCVSSMGRILLVYVKSAVLFYILVFLYPIVYVASPMFQCCTCLECYLAVVHPVVFLRYKPLRYRLACCGLVWMLVLVMSVFCGFNTSEEMFYFVNLGLDLLLMSVQLFCCLSVLRALKRPGPGEGQREGGSDIKRRAFKIILLILVTMLVIYLPFIVTVCLMNVLSRELFYFAIYISLSLSTVGGFVHPSLYLHRSGKLPCLNMAP